MVKFKELIDIYNEVRVNVRNKDKKIKYQYDDELISTRWINKYY